MKERMLPDLKWLEDPQVFQVGRLEAHSDHVWFETKEEQDGGKGGMFQSLNGEWKFRWSPCPSERPVRFYEEDFDDSGFDRIQVPGHMELQGYGQIQYTNTLYPWDGGADIRPPAVDWDHNYVGSYIKEFDLEEGLLGKRVCISFQGVEPACFVWLNGAFVGYTEDSFTPADFDLTDRIREKGNRLCVEVYRRCSASWLEDQDFFRFSGIFRDVYLYAKPRVHVEDLWVQAGLKEDLRTGTFCLKVKTSGEKGWEKGWGLRWELKDRAGETAACGEYESACFGPDRQEASRTEIREVNRWSSCDPYLYKLEITVLDCEGRIAEWIPCPVGFRRFEIKEGQMLLNGKRLFIKGVNRHEWNPVRGRAVTEQDMRRDMEILRKNHINAVRTSHYPNQSLWYRLCDENGIYVMDETNLETHGSWQKLGICEPSWNVPGSLPQWKECVLDRARSMLERDKNHPSVLWWSCGNESYAGECILAMSRYFHETDPSRPVHYEGVFWNREYEQISDLESRMYAPPQEVRDYLEHDPKKPFILCEYMHDMGNSLGGMESYMKLAEEFPMYQGGFIWDFIDQALYRRDTDGNMVLGYGGDFEDRPTDYAFSGNGLLFADRREKPAMEEVRYWYASAEERNRLDEEKKAAQKAADAAIEGEQRQKENRAGMLRVIRGDGTLGVWGENFHVLYSYPQHGPVSLVYHGTEWIFRPFRPAFWRASTDNDKGNGFPLKSAVWCGADQFILCDGWNVEEKGDRVTITYEYSTCTSPKAGVTVSYTTDSLGKIRVRASYHGTQGLPQLPLFGLRFQTPVPVECCRWMGLKGETYPDRKKGSPFGIWEEVPGKPDYLVPQEYGCHVDTRRMCLIRGSSRLRFTMSGRPFAFSAIPYTPQELECAEHKEELSDIRRTVVSVLGAVRGVGGIDSWGQDVEEAYQIRGEEDISFEFLIDGEDLSQR